MALPRHSPGGHHIILWVIAAVFIAALVAILGALGFGFLRHIDA